MEEKVNYKDIFNLNSDEVISQFQNLDQNNYLEKDTNGKVLNS